MNQTIDELNKRKSVHVYEDREIEPEKVNTILYAACMAPTAGNQQLYTIIKVSDQKIKDELADACDRKYNSDFAKEMSRSVAEYIREYI